MNKTENDCTSNSGWSCGMREQRDDGVITNVD